MMRSALDEASAWASVLATMNSTPCRPDAIMLLTALPPAPPAPNTTMRAFISRISVMLVIVASGFPGQAGIARCRLLPDRLAVCGHQVGGQVSRPPCSHSAAVDRVLHSTTTSQKTFKPRRRLLGCRGLRIGLQQFNHQPIGAFALTLEIGPVAPCRRFEPRDLRLHRRDLCREGDVARLAMARRPWRMPYFRKVHVHQCFAIMRKEARQPEPLGKRTSGHGRDCQASAKLGIRQCIDGHRLFSPNAPRGLLTEK